MRAVILAGGKGTRLRPYTTIFPKPLVPMGERPVLEMIIRQLAVFGFRRVDLCVGHLGNLIRAYFSEGTQLPEGVELAYHWEDRPLGTAGALRLIEDLDGPFLVMNGDVVTSLDYAELMQAHAKSDALVTISSYSKVVGMDLGVIETGPDGLRVTGYREKPRMPFTVSMGVYVFEPAAVEYIPRGLRFDFPDVVRTLIDAGEHVAIRPFEGLWYDIGTPADYERASTELEADPDLFNLG